tara:strand:+ start:550 stop:960 length:411 start_codon:yes stop_codon:yes gene_type:complete
MSNGLKKWFDQKWVDIGSKKKDGSFAKCGRSKQKADAKRKYPKCVPLAKATRMTKSQRASAVARKRAAGNTGPKPKNVKTFASRGKLISTAKKFYDSLEKVQINNPNMALQDKRRKKQYDKKNMGGIIDQTRMRIV